MINTFIRFTINIKSELIDYKNIYLLRKFITIQGKILPRNLTKLTSKQHRILVKSIKQSRILGLLPFINKETA
uniref:Small ribosomal subunit protein bS18c n=1 Tax=Lepocinclis tripteris TaxID=135494 RepID=A0A3G3LKZ1_9EUGL|nr:ribosomal protein S18 [Lepocinclis tripteris]AYQ93384.1 ribosomal protein S18 [Lepocinclis tripteris]